MWPSTCGSRPLASPVAVRLFGTFEVRLHGTPLRPLRVRKGEWLLALLILRHPTPMDRAWLAGLLWPDSAETRALNSLRVTLSDLRSALGPERERLCSPTPQTLHLDLAGAWVDLLEFDAAVASGRPGEPGEEFVPGLERAAALYRGPLLDGCGEPWIVPEREARHQAYLRTLETLAVRARERNDPQAEGRWLRCCVAADPLRESAQRALMRLLAEEGNQAAALALYRDLRLLLHRELCAAPDPETVALYERIRAAARARASAGTGAVAAPSRQPVSCRQQPLPHNLPHPVNRFIGREHQIAAVRHLLTETRLLTVTGAGGVGKTRFVLQVARRIAESRPDPGPGYDGVWLVELASLADPTFVPQAVAMALGVREEPGTPVLVTLVAFLRERRPLIVLDNCEHLIVACAELADTLLRSSADTRLLATSREPLKVAGEMTYRLPSLAVPDPACLPTRLEGLAEHESVQLFVDRARSALPAFSLTPENSDAVAGICSRLDGIALAIELAAGWVSVLPVPAIHERLGDRFHFLTGGSRTALPRHQTLLGTIDWSYALLSEAEQALLRRLSVFSGGAPLDAIEAVCDAGLDLLTCLVEKSLVVADTQGGEARYRLLETIRQYGMRKLEEAGETALFHARHLDWYTCFAERAPSGPVVAERRRWLERLEREHDNLRGALEWATATGDAAAGFRLAEGIAPLWNVRGHTSEGNEQLLRLLALTEAASPSVPKCRALGLLGEINWHRQDLPAMRAAYAEMLEAADAIGDVACRAGALCGLGVALGGDGGNRETERALLTESVALFRQADDPRGLAVALERLGHWFLDDDLWDPATARLYLEESLAILDRVGGEDRILTLEALALLAQTSGDFATARVLFQQNLATSQELGFSLGIWWNRLRLIDIDAALGEYAAARDALEAMLARERAAGSRGNVAILLQRLGDVARHQGDTTAALACYEECVALRRDLRSRRDLAHVLWGLGEVLVQRGDTDRAAEIATERLALRRGQGELQAIARFLRSQGDVAATQGDREQADRFYAEADALEGEGMPRGERPV
jgi:non-specific serine/threonine protein kinase